MEILKTHRLIDADGRPLDSPTKGNFGGRTGTGGRGFRGVYGRLDCSTALRAIARADTYAKHRVFFADEATAVAAGHRPCGNCMRAEYESWKARQTGER